MSSKSFNRFFNRFLLSIAAISIGNVAVLSLVPDRDSDRVSAQIPTKAQAQLKLPVSPKPRSGLRLTNPTTPNPAARSTGSEFIAPEGKTFLDPANPAVQSYLLSLYREILTRYKVDGIQLDYIRYPRQDVGYEFGFGTAARQQFKALTGIDPIEIDAVNRSLWWMWTEFRTRQVNQFVARVSKELRQIKPDIVISAAVFPWRPLDRINKIQQNWEA